MPWSTRCPGRFSGRWCRAASTPSRIRRAEAWEGRGVHFQANPDCPIYEELRSILKKTVGVADVLREALAPLGPKVRAAFVYGSASFGDVVAALAPAQESLRREVNPNVYPALEFRKKLAARGPFLKRVLAGHKIYIVGGADGLGKPAAHRPAQGARRR